MPTRASAPCKTTNDGAGVFGPQVHVVGATTTAGMKREIGMVGMPPQIFGGRDDAIAQAVGPPVNKDLPSSIVAIIGQH